MKYAYFGTPQFAAIILTNLIKSGMKPNLVVCAPDKPIGRKLVLTAPEAKKVALNNNIRVVQPTSVKNVEFLNKLKTESLDLIVVAAYGKILPKTILDSAKRGTINVHPSLLPKWRGPSPIQYSLLSNDSETGVSIMLLDEKMDHGPILSSKKYSINSSDNCTILTETLAHIGSEILLEVIPKWVQGDIFAQEQNHSKATYSKIINGSDGHINWNKTATDIVNMTRAYRPWPGAYTFWNTKKGLKKIIIINANSIQINKAMHKIGEVIIVDNKLAIQCGKNALLINKLKLEGKREMTAQEFLNGYKEFVSAKL